MGDTGEGKTHSIRTLVESGLECFAVLTEDARSQLNDIPPDKLHWVYVAPGNVDWITAIDTARKISQFSFKALTEMVDPNRATKHSQYIKVLEACNNFKCERCGKEFGSISTFSTGRAVVFDGITGISRMALQLVVGGKPVPNQGEWGIAMTMLDDFITKVTNDVRAWVVVMSHLERENDEVTGGIRLMPSTLGKKLAPKIPRWFDEVLRAMRRGSDFFWSTASTDTILKTRFLPFSEKLPPSFVQVVEAWKGKGGIIEPSNQAPVPQAPAK